MTGQQIPTAWTRQLRQLADYTGGWWMPLVCTGSGAHRPHLLCHVYEHASYGIAYSAPMATVRQTRQHAAIGVPGRSRSSIVFRCPAAHCSAEHMVDRSRWGQITADARRVELGWLDVAHLS